MLYKKINQSYAGQLELIFKENQTVVHKTYQYDIFDSSVFHVRYDVFKTKRKRVTEKRYWILRMELIDLNVRFKRLIWGLRQLGFDCFLLSKHSIDEEEERIDVIYQPRSLDIDEDKFVGWRVYKTFSSKESLDDFLKHHQTILKPILFQYDHDGLIQKQQRRLALIQQFKSIVQLLVNICVVIFLTVWLFSEQNIIDQFGYVVPVLLLMGVLMCNYFVLKENHEERKKRQFYLSVANVNQNQKHIIPDIPNT